MNKADQRIAYSLRRDRIFGAPQRRAVHTKDADEQQDCRNNNVGSQHHDLLEGVQRTSLAHDPVERIQHESRAANDIQDYQHLNNATPVGPVHHVWIGY